MKVSVYVRDEGRLDVMVEGSLGNGRIPVVVQDVSRGNLKARVRPVIDAQRGRRPRAADGPGPE